MPRASINTVESESKPRRSRTVVSKTSPTPRRRVSSSRSETADSSKPRTRRTVAPKITTDENMTTRRAPSTVFKKQNKLPKGVIFFAAALTLIATSVFVSAAIGMSDRGPIDVVALSNERQERIQRGEIQDTGASSATAPNTGLRPSASAVEDAIRPIDNPLSQNGSVEVPTSVDVSEESDPVSLIENDASAPENSAITESN